MPCLKSFFRRKCGMGVNYRPSVTGTAVYGNRNLYMDFYCKDKTDFNAHPAQNLVGINAKIEVNLLALISKIYL